MANEDVKMRNIEISLRAAAELFIKYGPSNTTKEMIAKQSGLSRRSIERYFKSSMDCVLQTSVWLSERSHFDMSAYSDEIFADGKYTAYEILEIYLNEVKKTFQKEPRMPICYVEIKTYIFRNSDDCVRDYEKFTEDLGVRSLVRRIFKLGEQDGSIDFKSDYITTTEYFYEMLMLYLSNMSMIYEKNPEKALENIDEYIKNTLQRYCIDKKQIHH
jgi:AcrR family transcriptional regulator